MKIGIVFIATGRYSEFISPLHASFERYFLTSHPKTYYLFTDAKKGIPKDIVRIGIRHRRWPWVALHKFHYIASIADRLRADHIEVVYFCDADMRVVSEINEEVLPSDAQPLVANRHPYEVHEAPVQDSIERNPKSTACIAPHEPFPSYARACFFGGQREALIQAAETIKKNVDTDTRNHMIAKVHDESHWNRYYASHIDLFKILPIGYPLADYIVNDEKEYAKLQARHRFTVKIREFAKDNEVYHKDNPPKKSPWRRRLGDWAWRKKVHLGMPEERGPRVLFVLLMRALGFKINRRL